MKFLNKTVFALLCFFTMHLGAMDKSEINKELLNAVKNGHTHVIELMLKYKADIEAKTSHKEATPIHFAAQSGHAHVIKLLLQNGADVNALEKDKWTPLHIAAKKGHAHVIELLLQNGANVNAQTKNKCTPLHHAAYNNHTAIAKLLIQAKANVDQANIYGETPLDCAVHNGNTAIAKLLIDAKANVDQADYVGAIPLHWAVHNGNTAIAKLLIDAKANVDKADKNGETPLHWAVRNGNTAIAKLLIQAGANVDKANNDEATPLDWAVHKGHTAIAELLIQAGANVNQTTKDGKTPLYSAACNGHTAIAMLLIQAGAKLDSNNKMSYTILDIVSKKGLTYLYKILAKQLPKCTHCLNRKSQIYLHCKHQFCSDCLIDQLRATQKDLNIELKCSACNALFTEQDVKNFTDTNKELVELFHAITFRKWIAQQKDVKHCPQPDCKGFGFVVSKKDCSNNVECPVCNHTFCSDCSLFHVSSISCEKAKEQDKEEQWKLQNTKPCPKCFSAIEKNEGCNHVKCYTCQYHFCWVCGQQFIIGPGANHTNYYNCSNQKINGWK